MFHKKIEILYTNSLFVVSYITRTDITFRNMFCLILRFVLLLGLCVYHFYIQRGLLYLISSQLVENGGAVGIDGLASDDR